MSLKMKPVKSSNIKEVGYDEPTRTLHVNFTSGAVYKFLDVSPEKHKALMAADSHGKHFMKHIRYSHQYEKLA